MSFHFSYISGGGRVKGEWSTSLPLFYSSSRHWQARRTAIDDTRIIVTPFIGGDPQIEAGEAITDKVAEVPFAAGDMLLCHTRWEYLARLEKDRDFVIVTSDYPRERQEPYKLALALAFFVLAIGMIIFTNILLPIALLTGSSI